MPPDVKTIKVPITQDEADALAEIGRQTGLTHPENAIRWALWHGANRWLELDLSPEIFQCRIPSPPRRRRRRPATKDSTP